MTHGRIKPVIEMRFFERKRDVPGNEREVVLQYRQCATVPTTGELMGEAPLPFGEWQDVYRYDDKGNTNAPPDYDIRHQALRKLGYKFNDPEATGQDTGQKGEESE